MVRKYFTLIELLVVIGIIGILAMIIVPSITQGVTDAKRSAAQSECKSFEKDIIKSNIETNNAIAISFKGLLKREKTNIIQRQRDMVRVLTGSIIFDKDGGHKDIEAISQKEGTFGSNEVVLDNGDVYGAHIDPVFFERDKNGKVNRLGESPDGLPAIKKSKFYTKYQLAYFQAGDGNKESKIVVYNPVDSSKILSIKGLKKNSCFARVIAFDNSNPYQLITSDGTFKLYTNKDLTEPATPDDLLGTKTLFINQE